MLACPDTDVYDGAGRRRNACGGPPACGGCFPKHSFTVRKEFRMNIRKITALVSAAALAVCMLAACGSNTDSPAETEPAEIIETIPAQ